MLLCLLTCGFPVSCLRWIDDLRLSAMPDLQLQVLQYHLWVTPLVLAGALPYRVKRKATDVCKHTRYTALARVQFILGPVVIPYS